MAAARKTTKKKTVKKAASARATSVAKASAKASGGNSPSREEATKAVLAEFKSLVNMTPGQIEKFLHTQDSTTVGFKKDGRGESVGHHSGRRIIEIKAKKPADLTADDLRHMKKVVGYINRHCKQGPAHKADVKESKWRYSLMNWGHDPLKGGGCGPSK